MNKMVLALPALLYLMVAGCVDAPGDRSAETADTDKAVDDGDKLDVARDPLVIGEARVETNPKGKISLDAAMQQLVELAKKDLATRLGIGEANIETLRAERVTWRDSSLGCPEPGSQYLQVLTNGSRIALQVEKRTYHYHSGTNRAPFLCAKPSANDPMPHAPGET